MSDRTCSIDGCEGKRFGHGWCQKHYARWWRHGDPLHVHRTETAPCTVDGCDRPGGNRGWCEKHYMRWYRHGDPTHDAQHRGDDLSRFWANVDKDGPGGCWLWTGATNNGGYGCGSIDGDRELAHRVAYRLLVGPIPEGLELDHVHDRGCRHRHCVNPAHLEPVTKSENNRRKKVA